MIHFEKGKINKKITLWIQIPKSSSNSNINLAFNNLRLLRRIYFSTTSPTWWINFGFNILVTHSIHNWRVRFSIDSNDIDWFWGILWCSCQSSVWFVLFINIDKKCVEWERVRCTLKRDELEKFLEEYS